MNLIEAVKSGKSFKRPKYPIWNVRDESARGRFIFHLDDILADDWQIEEESVTITRGEFQKAFNVAGSDVGGFVGLNGIIERVNLNILMKELGFK